MLLLRDCSLIVLLFLMTSGSSDVLLNGTNIYLSTGDSYKLYQGYVISLKSVSNDGLIWLQLKSRDDVVKSDIVGVDSYFAYDKNNRTIISIRVQNVYSGSTGRNLVALSDVHQFVDPDLPLPAGTIVPDETHAVNKHNYPLRIHTPQESLIWATGTVLTLVLIYILRKLW